MTENVSARGRRGPQLAGSRLRALRVRAGWSLADLGRLAGTNASYLSRLERGIRCWPHPRVTTALARALDVDLEELLADARVVDGRVATRPGADNEQRPSA